MAFPGGSDGEESTCNVGNLGSIPGLRRSPGGGHGNPLQYSCLENPHGQRNLVCYSPWGGKELNMTERLSTLFLRMMLVLTFLTLFLMKLVPLGRVLELSFLRTTFVLEFFFLSFFLPFPFFLFLPFFLSSFLLSFLLCFFLKGWDWPDHLKTIGPNVELLETKRP